MSPKYKKAWIVVGLILLSFIGGFWVANNINISFKSPSAKAQVSNTTYAENDLQQARTLAQQLSQAFESASDKVRHSVVPIFAEQEVQSQSPFAYPEDPFHQFFGDDFFKRFFGSPRGQKQVIRSMGSGVIVTDDGYILTNNHVVSGANKLTVIMENNKKYPAKVIGADPQSDVAVIKIDAKDLPVANLGNSDEVKVGQWVIAVGNPFQLLHTVTAGIISAKGRSSVGLADYEDFIQTDASINPGNSGGALADLDGNVIGINTAISTPSGGNVGIGFAIPINMARNIMDDLIAEGKVSRGYLGLLPQNIDEDLAKAMHLKNTRGALVADVTGGGPSDKAGIKRGDVIVALNGQKVENSTELRNLVAAAAPGSDAKVTLIRDGREMNITVKLGERPNTDERPSVQPQENTYQKLGLDVQNLTPDMARQLGYQNERGVIVANVRPGSAADDANLQRGDLIKEVNRHPVNSVQEFNNAISNLSSGDSVALLVRRGQGNFYVAIEMP